MAGHDWSREEVEATVADYFVMLHDELAGLLINKAAHNEQLRRLLSSRSCHLAPTQYRAFVQSPGHRDGEG